MENASARAFASASLAALQITRRFSSLSGTPVAHIDGTSRTKSTILSSKLRFITCILLFFVKVVKADEERVTE